MSNPENERHAADFLDITGFSDADRLIIAKASERDLLVLVLKEQRSQAIKVDKLEERFGDHETECNRRHATNDKIFSSMATRSEREMVDEGVRLWRKNLVQTIFWVAAGISSLATAAVIIWGVIQYVTRNAVKP